MTVDLAIGPGEEFAVQHTFVTPPPARPAAKPAPKPSAKAPAKAPAKEKSLWERFVDLFK
jgi:hypothetical protein